MYVSMTMCVIPHVSQYIAHWLQAKLADPEVAGDSNEYQRVAKAAAELQESVDAYKEIQQVYDDLQQAKSMLKESASEVPL